MSEQWDCHTQVSFSIFEINRVYFMWHSWRTNFTLNILLSEVSKWNIRPHISTEVNKDSIDMCQSKWNISYRVMWFNLSCIWVPIKIHAWYEILTNGQPIFFWKCYHVCIEVTSCSIELASRLYLFKSFNLNMQSVGKIGYFFTHSWWCGTLSMCSAKHWDIAQFNSELCKFILKAFELW